MLRILFCNYEYPPVGGGGGTCSKYLARELVKRGHSVEVVTARYGNLPHGTQRGGLTVKRIAALRKKPGQSNPLEMASYALSGALHLLFRGTKPDVVVSFHTIPSGLAALPLALLRRVPHIALLRGGDVPGWLPQRMALWHKATLPLNRAVVYTSDATMANSDGLRALAQRAFPKKRIGVLQNGVDLREFAPPEIPRSLRTSPVRLIFVGRITPQKGIDLLLKVLAGAKLRTMEWTLDIVGDGPQLADYVEYAKSLRIIERVNFHGWLERKAVKRLYADADMLVFPSRFEGMPNVVLEATACGLPVVATRTAGTVQIIEDAINGVLVNIDDEEGLAEGIERLVASRHLRATMGENARRLAEEHWSWQARAGELETVMKRVIAKRS